MSTVIDSYSIGSSTQRFNSASLVRYGQTFTAASYFTLDSCQFFLQKVGSPTGNFTAKIYNIIGTFGTTSIPTGNHLAESDPIDISTISTSSALVTFTFSGANRIFLALGNFAIALENNSQAVDASNYIAFFIDQTTVTHPGNIANYISGTWTANASNEARFVVSGTLIENYPGNTQPFLRVGNGQSRNERAT